MRKGFTLVELMITIAVIVILSASMIFSTPAMMSSGDAVNVVNNMRSIKSAVLEWYADNADCVVPDTNGTNVKYYADAARKGTPSDRLHRFVIAHPELIKKYMPNSNITLNGGQAGGMYAEKDGYSVIDGSEITNYQGYKTWYVVYYPFTDMGMKKNLAAIAEKSELLGDDKGKVFTADDKYLYMKIMDYKK